MSWCRGRAASGRGSGCFRRRSPTSKRLRVPTRMAQEAREDRRRPVRRNWTPTTRPGARVGLRRKLAALTEGLGLLERREAFLRAAVLELGELLLGVRCSALDERVEHCDC